MNKLMVYPMVIMLILSITVSAYSMMTGGITYDIMDSQGEDDYTFNPNGTSSTLSVDLRTPESILAVVAGGAAISVVTGISLLGSGLSTQAQRTLFIVLFYGGIWTVLMGVNTYTTLLRDTIFTYFLVLLSLLFILGMGLEIAHSGDI